MMTKPQLLASDTLIARAEDCVFTDLDREVVMINVETNSYYALDAIGSRIWELLAAPLTFEQLCTTLGKEFEVDAETCRRDVAALLTTMRDEQLIQIGAA